MRVEINFFTSILSITKVFKKGKSRQFSFYIINLETLSLKCSNRYGIRSINFLKKISEKNLYNIKSNIFINDIKLRCNFLMKTQLQDHF